MKSKIYGAIQWLARQGVSRDDTEDQRTRKGIFNVAVFFASSIYFVIIGPLYMWLGETLAGLEYVLVGLVFCLSIAFVQPLWGSYDRFISVISWMFLPACLLAHILLGGFVESGGILLWGLGHPVVTNLLLYGSRPAIRWFALFFLNLLIGTALSPFLNPTHKLPPVMMYAMFAMSVGFISFAITAVLAYFLARLEDAHRLVRGEQEKADNLLLNILPREIAAILKNDQRTIADSFEGASILFADVVNFTPLSAKMRPVELVDLLNEVFSQFDVLVEKYGLEKIKTIGDCYMVAAGVPRPRTDHAVLLTQLALEMRDFIQRSEFSGHRLSFRIGINSGPVVAGVIGRKKFIYDLWGDAVNTASRMESHGQAGVIQITRNTYELIKDGFTCEPHGTIHVKGKGDMDVWFVVGRAGG
ncbi:MAG: guanylate cyclase [Ignavibacteriales bacterium]|nr:guanylate cyclase [Ignavibacteriales bacterium]